MMNATDWLDYLRLTTVFEQFDAASEKQSPVLGSTTGFYFRRKGDHDKLYWENMIYYTSVIDNRPCFIMATNPKTIGDISKPHAPAPAAAQTLDQMTIVWVKTTSDIDIHKVEDGIYGMPASNHQDVLDGKNTKIYGSHCVNPYRDDGFPAVLVIDGLRKFYNSGLLHRNGGHPALIANKVGAIWSKGQGTYRNNGPTSVLVDGYKEFYNKGRFKGYRYDEIWEDWGALTPPVTSNTNPLSNRYFIDPQDELIWIGENLRTA